MTRPSDYSDSLAADICALIADGRSLRSICRQDEFPDKATVLRWLADPRRITFRDQYVRAREAQADALVEECLEIADDGTNDYVERENGQGESVTVVNHDHIARSRLRVDTRKWWAARLAPKKYGDRISAEISGDKDRPLVMEHRRAAVEHEVDQLIHSGKLINGKADDESPQTLAN